AGNITEPRRLGFAETKAPSEEAAKMRQNVMDALKHTFKPEFLNRVDEIIIFDKLSDENIRAIAGIMLSDVTVRINGLGIAISFDDEVIASLAKEGFDPVYGARPLRRAIVRRVEDSFSEAMLRGEIQAGDTVSAVLDDGTIRYKVAEKSAE
ncbi:MAG: AAA family ATPase, partial [Lentisphaeria bacterium]|nr:AAA family ATPase [Lentisphaeria bacterium]